MSGLGDRLRVREGGRWLLLAPREENLSEAVPWPCRLTVELEDFWIVHLEATVMYGTMVFERRFWARMPAEVLEALAGRAFAWLFRSRWAKAQPWLTDAKHRTVTFRIQLDDFLRLPRRPIVLKTGDGQRLVFATETPESAPRPRLVLATSSSSDGQLPNGRVRLVVPDQERHVVRRGFWPDPHERGTWMIDLLPSDPGKQLANVHLGDAIRAVLGPTKRDRSWARDRIAGGLRFPQPI